MGPRVGEVTCSGLAHLSCKCDQIKMRDYMNWRVTPPKRVTSPTWGPPPPCKQALNLTMKEFTRMIGFVSLMASAEHRVLRFGKDSLE